MATPVQIGITGGIGSGKSIVTRIFSGLGVPIYDADSHAKALMTTDGILVESIKKEFGALSYDPDGSLNRTYLAKNVFHDDKALEKLNALVHPRIAIDYQEWLVKQTARYVIKEAALIYEANTHHLLDKVIVVTAPVEMRIRRVLARDNHRTVEQIKAIVEKQMPEGTKVERADYIIVNDESTLVIPQVLALHQKFLSM